MDSTLFSKYQLIKKSKKHEWGELVRFFMEEVNKERIGTKWKPLSEVSIACKIAHLKKGDDYSALYHLKSICLDSKNRCGSFSKCFWGSLKV